MQDSTYFVPGSRYARSQTNGSLETLLRQIHGIVALVDQAQQAIGLREIGVNLEGSAGFLHGCIHLLLREIGAGQGDASNRALAH